jgi:hypothetical protein
MSNFLYGASCEQNHKRSEIPICSADVQLDANANELYLLFPLRKTLCTYYYANTTTRVLFESHCSH